MWFGELLNLPYFAGFLLLALTCVALVSALHVWAIRGAAAWWLRWGLVAGMAVMLLQIEAGDLLAFVLGHLIACLCLSIAISEQRPNYVRHEAIPLAVILVFELLAAAYLHPSWHYAERYWLFGLCAGWAAVMVDVALRRKRYWFLWAVLACASGIALEYVAAGIFSGVDLLGYSLQFNERGTIGYLLAEMPHELLLLECGTLLYALWRVALRLAVVAPSTQSAAAVRHRLAWSDLGKGLPRVFRLVLVWPIVAVLSFIIFTPALEAYLRMPGAAQIPPQPTGSNSWDELLAFPDSLDWTMAPYGEVSESIFGREKFYQSNVAKMAPLDRILQQPLWMPINYAPKSPSIERRDQESLRAVAAATYAICFHASVAGDATERFESARRMLELVRTYRRGVLETTFKDGRELALVGMTSVYDSRNDFSAEQCRALIALLRSLATTEDSLEVIQLRQANWLLTIRGWRERVDRACNPRPYEGLPDSTLDEKCFQAMRATLLAELALRQFALDHDGQSPTTLDELAPKYLDAIPTDPFSGGPVLHQRSGSGAIREFVYSVGPNGRSDGGVPAVPGRQDGPDDCSIAHPGH